jgi:pimeloyl-ACP methyl ester carboxylesterase
MRWQPVSDWHRTERGSGRTLVLLHGGGATSRTWTPVLDRLAERRHVVAFDFPGFGRTAFPKDVEFTMDWLLDALADQLAELGIRTPVDIAGNSMGGWVALEAAKRGMARSVVALGPAGLWRNGMPPLLRAKFRAGLVGARLARGREAAVLRSKVIRTVAFSQIARQPSLIPVADAAGMLREFDLCRTAFDPILRVAKNVGFTGGHEITAPITIAYGSSERMLQIRTARDRSELPAHTRWVELPGCGHVPMWDAPDLVADTILLGTQ